MRPSIQQFSRLVLMAAAFFAPIALHAAPPVPTMVAETMPVIRTVSVGSAPRTAWFVPRSTAPIVSVQLQFTQGGYAYDPEPRQGLAFLASQLLMEGAGSRDAIAFQKMLDAHAIQLSADVDEDMLTVQVTALRDHADAAFALLRDALAQPRFDEEAVQRLKARFRNDLKRLQENPSYLAGQLWRSTVYAQHPYRQQKRGMEATLATITREDLVAYKQRAITTGQVQISASGDMTEAELQRWLKPVLDSMPQQGSTLPELKFATPLRTPKPLVQPFSGPQTNVVFSYPGLTRKDPDYFTLLVMNQILGGQSLGSRLAQALRDKGGMTYGVSTVIDTNAASAQLLGFFSTRNAKASEAFRVMMHELQEFCLKGVTEDEVTNAKSYLIGSLAVQLDGTDAMVSFLSTLQRYGQGTDYFATRTTKINAVTRDKVNILARSLLRLNPMVAVAGSPDQPLSFDLPLGNE